MSESSSLSHKKHGRGQGTLKFTLCISVRRAMGSLLSFLSCLYSCDSHSPLISSTLRGCGFKWENDRHGKCSVTSIFAWRVGVLGEVGGG